MASHVTQPSKFCMFNLGILNKEKMQRCDLTLKL